MKLAFLREAEDEVNQAIAYYEEIEPGLGIRLKEETRRLGQWIEHNSTVPSPKPPGYRRVNLRVFPYYIAYFMVTRSGFWPLPILGGAPNIGSAGSNRWDSRTGDGS